MKLTCLHQKKDLTVSEARLLTQNGGDELGKENGPSEAALLQASVSRLSSDIEELRMQCAHKDAEITSLRSQLDKAQADLMHSVSAGLFVRSLCVCVHSVSLRSQLDKAQADLMHSVSAGLFVRSLSMCLCPFSKCKGTGLFVCLCLSVFVCLSVALSLLSGLAVCVCVCLWLYLFLVDWLFLCVGGSVALSLLSGLAVCVCVCVSVCLSVALFLLSGLAGCVWVCGSISS